MINRRNISVISLAVLATIYAFQATASTKCDLCGNEISGTYYQISDGRIFCNNCWTSNKICDLCGQLTRTVINSDGHDYCSSCYAKLERCTLCGNVISGSYVRYPAVNLVVCDRCERERPRCDKCGVPMVSESRLGTALLCDRCARDMEFCHSCGEPLLKDYSFFEGNELIKFCFQCTGKYPKCGDCGAPSGPFGTKLDDGRYLCPDCRKIAYFEPEHVLPIKTRVEKFLSTIMGISMRHKLSISLERKSFLETKAKNIHGDLNGLFYRNGDKYYVYVLYGLREKDLLSVLAHELTHAWQAENCSENLPLEDVEGFAQWVAFKTLNHHNYSEFAQLMLETDNIYSRGLRNMLSIEKTKDTKGVFDYIKRKL